MSSYEKQMQWKKATTVKAKKDKDERTAAGESYSFTPVMYTSSSHAQKDGSEQRSGEVKPPRSDKSRRESSSKDSRHARNTQDSDLYSPMRGGASVSSHQNSEAGTQSASGYGNAYSEQLVSRGYDDQPQDGHHARHHRQRGDHLGDLNNVEEDDRDEEEERSHENSRPLRTTLSRSTSNPQYERGGGDSIGNRRRSQGSTRHRGGQRDSSAALRRSSMVHNGGRDSPDSSLDGSSGGEEEEDEADEPIIELLERERKQWREEREKLIQCIHLQQLELSQRSVAAHERAADIAKEFARAIEGFEERLVSVEGTVQKEIMSIKTIAESLLHAAQAQSSPHASGGHGGGGGANNSTSTGSRV